VLQSVAAHGGSRALPPPALLQLFDRVASSKQRRGVALLSAGRVVVTERLHGHLLCLLLGIPHVVLDNDYGKVHAFVRSWTEASPLCRLASSPEDALAQAQALAGEVDGNAPAV
jgi:pyruvyl transferase EpsO